jgi:hypothetical protein
MGVSTRVSRTATAVAETGDSGDCLIATIAKVSEWLSALPVPPLAASRRDH